MSSEFHIHKGVPIPGVDHNPNRLKSRYPLESMEVGAMIFVPRRTARSMSAYVARISRNLPGRYVVRQCHAIATEVQDGKPIWSLVDEGTPSAVEGAGVWRTE